MKARAGVSLAIVTTVEVEVEFELQVSSIFQQILKKGLNLNSKRALGLRFNCIWEGGGGGPDLYRGGELKGGTSLQRGGTDSLSPVSLLFPPQG